MKGQAVHSKDQQRKEARRKENVMLIIRDSEEPDQGESPVWRAAIYLREPDPHDLDGLPKGPSIDQQRLLCRCTATVLGAGVIGEFIDSWASLPLRPGLRQVLELASLNRRLDYLFVSSRDRLTSDCDEAFEIAWRLGYAGTVMVPADEAYEFPWTGATPNRS
jgi:hypothetical protein